MHLCASNSATKYAEQKWKKLKEEIDKCIITVRDSTSLSTIERTVRQKMSQETELKNTINQ